MAPSGPSTMLPSRKPGAVGGGGSSSSSGLSSQEELKGSGGESVHDEGSVSASMHDALLLLPFDEPPFLRLLLLLLIFRVVAAVAPVWSQSTRGALATTA